MHYKEAPARLRRAAGPEGLLGEVAGEDPKPLLSHTAAAAITGRGRDPAPALSTQLKEAA